MCNSQNSALFELFSDCFLKKTVSFNVHCRGRLVKDQNFGFSKKSTSQTYQLSLTNTEDISR